MNVSKYFTDKMYHKIFNGSVIMILMVTISLFMGMIGYHHFVKLTWTDSFLNAAMILTGMGPVHEPPTDPGKIFAGIYALYSGIIFLSAIAIFIFPVIQKIGAKLNHNHEDHV